MARLMALRIFRYIMADLVKMCNLSHFHLVSVRKKKSPLVQFVWIFGNKSGIIMLENHFVESVWYSTYTHYIL